MAFHAQLFWIAVAMQHLQGRTPLETAARLLPQALVGLVVSPLVGLVMHRVPGTALLFAGAAALVLSNVLLMLLHRATGGVDGARDATDGYFIYVFPALILSTLGMDWIVNVGSVSRQFQA